MNATVTSGSHRLLGAWYIGLGLGLLAFHIVVTLFQIQTSEAFILGGGSVSIIPNWSILMQPLNLLQGHISQEMAKAAVWGWGSELIFLVCTSAYEICHESIKASNRALAPWFKTGAIAITALNAYSDFMFGTLSSGPWGQLAFAIAGAFGVAFFGLWSVRLIGHGIALLK